MAHDDELLPTREAATILGIKPGTLEVWRSTRRHPLPFVKVGSAIRYKRSDLQKFIDGNTVGASD